MRDAFGRVQSLVVLGGGSDLGAAIAERLVADGCATVVLCGRNPARMAPVADRLRRAGAERVEVLAWDATDVAATAPSSPRRSTGSVGDVDCVLHAAGVLGNQKAFDADPTTAAEALTANYTGAVTTLLHTKVRLVEPGPRRHRGDLVGRRRAGPARPTTSTAPPRPASTPSPRASSDDLAGTGVDVLVVRPGWVRTAMTEGLDPAPFATTPEAVAAAVADGLARRRVMIWAPPVLRAVYSGLRHLPRPLWRRVSAKDDAEGDRRPPPARPTEAVDQERPRLRRPRRRRRARRGRTARRSAGRRPRRLRLLLPGGVGHLLPERRPRRRGRPPPPDEARTPGRVGTVPVGVAYAGGVALLVAAIGLALTVRWPLAVTVAGYAPSRRVLPRAQAHRRASTSSPSPPGSCCAPSAAPPPPTCRSRTGSSSSPRSARCSWSPASAAPRRPRSARTRRRSAPSLESYTPAFLAYLRSVTSSAVLVAYCLWAFEKADARARRTRPVVPAVDPALRRRHPPLRPGARPGPGLGARGGRARRPGAAGDRAGVGARVRHRRLPPPRDRPDRAPVGLGAHGARRRRPSSTPPSADELGQGRGAGPRRAASSPAASAAPTATPPRTPAAWWSTPPACRACSPSTATPASSGRSPARRIDDLLRVIVPAGWFVPGHARHPVRDDRRGHRRRHPRQEPPRRRHVRRPRALARARRRPTARPHAHPDGHARGVLGDVRGHGPDRHHRRGHVRPASGSGRAGCSVDTDRVPDLDTLLARAAPRARDRYRYSVAWIDLLARGRHARPIGADPGRLRPGDGRRLGRRRSPTRRRTVADARRPPDWLLNRLIVRPPSTSCGTAGADRAPRRAAVDRHVLPPARHASPGGTASTAGGASCSGSASCRSAPRTRCARCLEALADRAGAVVPRRAQDVRRRRPRPAVVPVPGVDAGPRRARRVDRRWPRCSTGSTGGSSRPAAASTWPRTAACRPELVPAMYPRLDEWRAERDRLDPDRRITSDLARRLRLLG